MFSPDEGTTRPTILLPPSPHFLYVGGGGDDETELARDRGGDVETTDATARDRRASARDAARTAPTGTTTDASPAAPSTARSRRAAARDARRTPSPPRRHQTSRGTILTRGTVTPTGSTREDPGGDQGPPQEEAPPNDTKDTSVEASHPVVATEDRPPRRWDAAAMRETVAATDALFAAALPVMAPDETGSRGSRSASYGSGDGRLNLEDEEELDEDDAAAGDMDALAGNATVERLVVLAHTHTLADSDESTRLGDTPRSATTPTYTRDTDFADFPSLRDIAEAEEQSVQRQAHHCDVHVTRYGDTDSVARGNTTHRTIASPARAVDSSPPGGGYA